MSRINSTENYASDLAEQYRLNQAEKEELQASHEREIENLKKSYATEKAALTDRFESSLQGDTLKHYDNLRTTKQQMKRAEDDLEKKRNELLSSTQDDNNKTLLTTVDQGKKAVENEKKRYAAALAYEQQQAQEAELLTRSSHKRNAELIIQDSDKKIADLYSQKQDEVERSQARNKEAIEQIKSHFDEQISANDGYFKNNLQELQAKTQAELDQRRLNNSQLLSQYSTRQADPFYQMVRADSELTDQGDSYVLRVRVPSYERENVRAAISGQEIQLSGTRTNTEQAEIAPGNWISTSSSQNFTERYTLPAPVDGKTLTMKEDGDWLEYTVLKYGPSHHVNTLALEKERDRQADAIHTVDFPSTLIQPTALPRRGRV